MTKVKKPRGFAAMKPELARELQSRGGKASPTRFTKDDDRAREAGRKGGKK